MADYLAKSRTNYFRVTDLESFTADLIRHGLTPGDWNDHSDLILDSGTTNRPEGAIALFYEGDWPMLDADSVAMRLDLEDPEDPAGTGQPTPSDYDELYELIAAHLVDTDVAVLISVGSEKMAYFGGAALAVNSRGDIQRVMLDDIYAKAAKLKLTPDSVVTDASY